MGVVSPARKGSKAGGRAAGGAAPKLALIGGGKMGGAIATRVVQSGLYAADRVVVSEPDAGARARLAAKGKEAGGPVVVSDNVRAIEGATTVLLAVIPQAVAAAAESLRGELKPSQLVVSIAAGVELETLRTALGHEAIIRVMPNTPAQVGEGISAWIAT